ncbi:hypothetical protein LG288_05850 [Idiomarina seosinensis]|uniref:hypothetical protein n=1 Tax=Idiomarina seosinensis TaxID=281739 RepID=UPI00384C6071
MGQPQIDIITPDGEAPLDGDKGYELFKEQVARLNQATSQRESNLASRFNALNETDQQVWLKAAGCPLLTDYLKAGGQRITLWRQLRKDQRNRMMTAYRCIKVIARGEL